jgi:hypothetical protein
MARNESPWLCCWLELAALKNRQRLAYAATVAGLLEREGWAIEAPPEPTPAAIAAAAMAADQLAAIALDAQTAEDAALIAGPALAEVLAEGKVKGGYYWQKVSASNGTRYLCRSTTDGRIQKAAACTAAGAVKP